jgi:TolB-like protein/DNA-binding SARP family transcriptional activator
MPLTVELFGGFRLFDAERRTIRIPDRRARALIAYLALAERAVPRLTLAELLCSEGDEQDQRTALRQAVYVARKTTAQPDLFVSMEDQIGLNEALLASDARAFQAAIMRGDPESLCEALDLYRGPLLAGERSPTAAFEDWLSGRRSELLEQVMKALLTLAEQHEAAGEHDPALALARRALTLDPLREDARRQVMRSLAALGQRAAALREYEVGRQQLADELQVGPDDDTEMLRDAISRGEETLANGPSAPPDRAERGTAVPVGKTVEARRAGALRRSAPALATILALVTAGLATWWYSARPQPPATPAGAAVAEAALPLPDKPSIAVLPFQSLSDDPKQERLADGITEDVITDLSQFRGFFVIARNSTQFYEGKAVDIRQIGRELGVQYVVEGSLQVDGNRVRITAQLIDATTGSHVWSEQYDRPLDDVFAVQDEVTEQIVGTLGGWWGRLAQAGREVAHRKPPKSLDAYDLYLLGIELKHRHTKEDNRKAQEVLKKAIALDPEFAAPYAVLALSYLNDAAMGFGDDPAGSLRNMRVAAAKGVALDDADAMAHLALALGHFYDHQTAAGANEFERALTLGQNNADLLAIVAFNRPSKLPTGKEDVKNVRRAMRLNPHHPEWYLVTLGYAAYHGGLYDEAVAALRQVANHTMLEAPLYLALSLTELGRQDEAAAAVQELLQIEPDFSAERQIDGDVFRDREIIAHFIGSVRKAGLPICMTESQLARYPGVNRLPECETQSAGG